MAVNIGPKIGIDGEAEFRKEINNLVQQQKTLASELKAVTSAFDKNDNSEESLTAQTKVLNQQIQVQQQRVEKLSQGLSESAKQFGETDSRTLKWKQSVNEATAELNRMKSQLSGLENSVDDVGDAMDDASGSTLSFKNMLSANGIVEAIKGIASAISDIVENTSEFRKIMGTLETSSQAAGYTADQTSEAYYQLFWALGDTQTAATATANLQALKLSQEDLNKMIELTVGAWATYGDSIPIDGLAESINETIKAGQVTGTFADVLNWGTAEGETFGVMLKENTDANKEWNEAVESAETAEDYFNLALQSANSEAERANIVMQAMASQGLADTADAWYDNNKQIVDANDAQLRMQEAMASFAETIGPAVNAVKTAFADAATKAAELAGQFVNVVQTGSPLIALLAGAAVAAGTLAIALNMSAIIQTVSTALNTMKTAVLALNAAIAANPIGLLVSLIAGLIAAIAVLWTTNEEFRQGVIAAFEEIKSTVQKVVSSIVNFFTVTVPNAFSTLLQKAVQIKNDVSNAFVNMRDSISNSIGRVRDSIVNGIQNAVSYITSLPGQAVTWGSDMIQGLANGVLQGLNSLLDAVRNVADRIRSYLHFSRPDTGPLRDYETWMPDMMEGMAKGIRQNAWQLEDALNAATSHMGVNVSAQMAGASAGGVNMGGVNIVINAAPGMDVNALADVVAYRLQTLAGRKEAVW